MPTHDRETQGVLDALDSVLVRAIKGAFWFPLVYLPRQLHRAFPLAVKLIRLGVLFAVWAAFVFGPLVFLEEVGEPVFGVAIVGWSFLAVVGSLVGVMKLRKSAPAIRRANKPADLAEAFV